MDYEQIKWTVLDVLKHCEVKSFPIDCISLLSTYRLKCNTYQEQSQKKLQKCFQISDDAFTAKNIVFYNGDMPYGRIRFSLMHELAHKVLLHGPSPSLEQESEADFFASHILAPRMAIHYARCKDRNDVAKMFDMSLVAAKIAYNDYRRWYSLTTNYKMTLLDKFMYLHFYNNTERHFIYNIKQCAFCDTPIYNSKEYICKKCKNSSRAYMQYQPPSEDFLISEHQWLYKGL